MAKADRRLAVDYLEDTVPDGVKVPARVREYAEEMAGFVESLTDDFVQAGGVLQRIRDNYVYHSIPPEQWARFDRMFKGGDETVFGTAAKFTKHRSHPDLTIRKLRDLGFAPLDDLASIVYARAAAHNRAMADMATIRSLQRHKWSGEDGPLETTLARFRDDEILLPRSVNETLKRVQDARDAFPRTQAARVAASANAKWKTWALLTTGYDIRNQIGDMILIAQAGHNPFTAIGRGLEALAGRNLYTLRGVRGRGEFTHPEINRMSAMLGASRTGQLYREVRADLGEASRVNVPGRFGSSASAPVRAGQAVRRGRENLIRAGLLSGLVKSEGPLLAAERANRALFDYGDVGRITQTLRTSPLGAPFVSWLVKNIPAQTRHIFARPRNPILLGLLMQKLQEESGDPTGLILSDFMRKQGPVPIPGVGFVTGGAPWGDVNRFGPIVRRRGREFGVDVLGNLAPVPQIALTLGGRTFSGGEVPARVPKTGGDEILHQVPFLGPLILGPRGDYTEATGEAGERTSVPAVSGLGAYITRPLNPALSTYGRIAGDEGRGRSAGDPSTIRDIFTGLRVVPFDSKRDFQVAINRRVSEKIRLERQYRSHARALRRAGVPFTREDLPEYRDLVRVNLELRELRRRKP
jgi:plasmid stability protein